MNAKLQRLNDDFVSLSDTPSLLIMSENTILTTCSSELVTHINCIKKKKNLLKYVSALLLEV